MGKKLIITEKPSVAREFARVLGESMKNHGEYLESENYIITWCVGHLVTMSYPDAYDEKFKRWSLETIPFIPQEYKYEIIGNVSKQFQAVKRLFHREDVDVIYNAGDSGREGEYIQRLVLQEAGYNGHASLKRIWIDSQTEEEILRGDRLNENYILYENAIYDNSAKEVKRLEDGRGVKSILYTNGQYWIVTNSNWYYILDDKFNEVLKPVEINNADDYRLTQYGLLLEIFETDESGKSQQNAYLYDEKGEAVLKMTGVDIDNDLHGFTLGNKKAGWTNLQTKQFMLVSIPKGGVSQMVQ